MVAIQLYSPIRDLSDLANLIYTASASAERIIEFLDEEPSVPDAFAIAALVGGPISVLGGRALSRRELATRPRVRR